MDKEYSMKNALELHAQQKRNELPLVQRQLRLKSNDTRKKKKYLKPLTYNVAYCSGLKTT